MINCWHWFASFYSDAQTCRLVNVGILYFTPVPRSSIGLAIVVAIWTATLTLADTLISHVRRKPALCHVRTTKAQISLHPRSLISAFVVRCLDSIIPLVSISEISSLFLASVAAQAGLCLTWSQTPKTCFSWRGSYKQLKENDNKSSELMKLHALCSSLWLYMFLPLRSPHFIQTCIFDSHVIGQCGSSLFTFYSW